MKIKSIFLIFVLIVLYSCTPTGLYYYGNYSNTLYNFKKAPTDKELLIHIEELDEIIKISNKKKLRVPPGIYAELGFYYSQKEDFEKALKLYKLESITYPESSKFMTILIENIKSTTNIAN